MKSGLTSAIDLVEKTPVDVQQWLVTEFNNWGKAAGFNMQQHFELIDRTEKAWDVFKKKQEYRVRNLPTKGEGSYASLYKNWLLTQWQHPRLTTWSHYAVCKSLLHNAKQSGYWTELVQIWKHEYDSHTTAHLDTIVVNMHAIDTNFRATTPALSQPSPTCLS